MESFALSFASMLLALAVVLALAWVVLKVLRSRMQPRGPAGSTTDEALRFVRALPVGTKERVVIVEHRGQRWMLGVTAGGISTIAHWPDPASVAAAATAQPVPPSRMDAAHEELP
jgi:flagellar protein FliO/FliZ